MIIAGAVLIAAALWWAARQIAGELRATRDEAARTRTLTLLALFAPALRDAQGDPRALLAWQPCANTARHLFAAEFAELDRAAGAPFPFTLEDLQAAHARWTTEWLAWERAHDATYKLKAAALQQEVGAAGVTPALRGRLEAIEQEKLDLYQRRYAEYVRIGKALQALTGAPLPH
jgi:hypothetical protein